MSICVFGTFTVDKKMKNEAVNLSLALIGIATIERFGLKLGGNVQRNEKSGPQLIAYEILDSPLDVNAHCLFGEDGVAVMVNGCRADTGESLRTRLRRVENLFKRSIELGVLKIELNLSAEGGAVLEIERRIKLSEFVSTIEEAYRDEERVADLKLIIEV